VDSLGDRAGPACMIVVPKRAFPHMAPAYLSSIHKPRAGTRSGTDKTPGRRMAVLEAFDTQKKSNYDSRLVQVSSSHFLFFMFLCSSRTLCIEPLNVNLDLDLSGHGHTSHHVNGRSRLRVCMQGKRGIFVSIRSLTKQSSPHQHGSITPPLYTTLIPRGFG
jgi:hypothetical protein